MSKFVRNREKIVSVNEFIEQVELANQCCQNIIFQKYDNEPIMDNAYFWETTTKFYLTWRLLKTKITYVCDKNDEAISKVTVMQVMSDMNKTFKVQNVSDILDIEYDNEISPIDDKKIGYRENIGSAKALLYVNEKFRDGKAHQAYEYDLAHAYGQMLKLPLPDITTCERDCVLKEGQIGFLQSSCTRTGTQLRLVEEPGYYVDFAFNLMPSPYIKWVDRIEKHLDEETDPVKRNDWKNYFRYAVGQFQNKNPFWRAMIVERCNNLVEFYKDENTIYCNTDCIVSTVRRIDIEQDSFNWKPERQNELFELSKVSKFEYQWNDEVPVTRGIKKLYIENYNRTHSKPWKINDKECELPKQVSSLYEFETFKSKYNDNRIRIVKRDI